MSKERNTLASVFGQAIAHVGPGIVAAMGSEDPQEIYKAYNSGMTSLQKAQDSTLNREQKRQKLAQNIANSSIPENEYDFGFVNKKTGQTVRIDKKAGVAYDLKGQEVSDIENIVEGETYRKMMGLQAIENSRKTSTGQTTQGPSDSDIIQIEALDENIKDGQELVNWFGSKPENRNVTGLYDGTVRSFIDSQGGSDRDGRVRAAMRLKLQRLFVGEILKNTEKTKGAISDREMEVFERGIPNLRRGEKEVRDWVLSRLEIAKKIRHRIATGEYEVGFVPASPARINSYFKTKQIQAHGALEESITKEQVKRKSMPNVQNSQSNAPSYDDEAGMDAFLKYGE